MSTARYVRWQDGGMWLGYFEQFPGYLTQGESLTDLEEKIKEVLAKHILRKLDISEI